MYPNETIYWFFTGKHKCCYQTQNWKWPFFEYNCILDNKQKSTSL